MQTALRLARQSPASLPGAGLSVLRRPTPQLRALSTAHVSADAASVSSTPSSTSTSAASSSSSRAASVIPLSNVEAQWATLSNEEKATVHEQLEVLQKKDWKELSIDEKKAAYYVAFGPHGPRAPASKPGDTLKIFGYTVALIGAAGLLSAGLKAFAAAPPPRTLTKEWKEAENERGLEMKLNPITGIASEGYKGKGFV
ncbi:hypothetical protein AX17_006776 [Amanita inopinata Kibby_2008]|nr:hypothetical protein AX17_006776 [Amanita inopinata Kibby_2008]